MKKLLSISFLAPLAAAALLAGCTVGVGGPYPGRYPDRYPDRDPNGAMGTTTASTSCAAPWRA